MERLWRFDALIEQILVLNREIAEDRSLGRGFRIGHTPVVETFTRKPGTGQGAEETDRRSYHSENLYQIFTYVKHQDKHGLGNVAGMLFYARTDEAFIPDCAFTISGNKIMIKTLDLNLEFKHIAAQLDGIAESVRRSSHSEKAARRTTPSVM